MIDECGPAGWRQHAPGVHVHHWLRCRRSTGPAVRVKGKHVFPLGWVYRRADGGESESIARKLHAAIGFPEQPDKLGSFTDEGQRVWPEAPLRN